MTVVSKLPLLLLIVAVAAGCSGDNPASVNEMRIAPAPNADAGSSYTHAKADIHIAYSSLPRPSGTGDLSDAIAYLDADGDGDTDVFVGTGEYLTQKEVSSILAINDGTGKFASSTLEFGGQMPTATHARKAITSDFNGDGLDDVFIFDHGYDAMPFPGGQPKLIVQENAAEFSWKKMTEQTGFHHGGAAADIDNDGDIDIFVGGFDPFFYVNDGTGAFEKVDDRFVDNMAKVFSAELIDVDRDGFVDLLAGAHERDGDATAIYWGNPTGVFSSGQKTLLPALSPFGAVLDFDAEDLDGDGDRDLVINRTRDGDDGGELGFYVGRTVQYLRNEGGRTFVDRTLEDVDFPGGERDPWFAWIRMQDVDGDGDLDFGPDNLDEGFAYINNGVGKFSLQLVASKR